MSEEKKYSVFWAIVLPLINIAAWIIAFTPDGNTGSIFINIFRAIATFPFTFLLFFRNSYGILFLSIPANILFWALVGYFLVPKANRLIPKDLQNKNNIGHWFSRGILFVFVITFGIYFLSPSRDCAVNLKKNTRLYKADRNVCFAREKYIGEEVGGKGIIFEAEVFPEADYDSFEYVLASNGNQDIYYKDKNNVYKLTDNEVIILEDIDPMSFDENYFEKE